ncbi:MAG TPA: acyltransferase [Thermodesulfobacteriota bacterium]
MNEKVKFLNSIALLRVIAVSFVIYAHLVGQREFVTWWPKQFLTKYFFEPLNIFQQGGALGVAIFFLVSGYIIPYVAHNESLKEFTLKRFFRIYPPFLASVCFLILAFYFLSVFGIKPLGFGKPESLSYIFLSASLLNFFLNDVGNINGVAWTLLIEVVFYIWIAITMKILFKRPMPALLLTSILFLALLKLHILHAQVVLSYIFVFVIFMFLGTLLYLRQSGLINKYFLFITTGFFWILFFIGIEVRVGSAANPTTGYIISYGLAYVIFATTVFLELKIKLNSLARHISKISYSLYLFHGGIGIFIVTSYHSVLGYPLSLAVALLIIVPMCTLSYRFIEKPSQDLARQLVSGPAIVSRPTARNPLD